MDDELICAHCGEPIAEDEQVAYPFVNSDNPTHMDCAHDAAMDEVADVYNEEGPEGLENFDKQSDIKSILDNTKQLNKLTQLDADWER